MVWWCPSVRVSVRLSVRPTLRPSVRVSVRQFSTLFSIMLWHIELKFCIWLCFTVPQIKYECRQFVSSFVGVMPLLELRILEIHSFPHFSHTCFDILSWNFANDFVLLYFRSSSSVVNFSQVLWELCPFWNLEYWKYTVFCTFLQHALTYWAEILQMTLFTVLQIKFECCQFASSFVGVMPLLELRLLEIHSFPHFSLACFDILSWNFANDFVLLYYRSSSSVVNLRQVLWELCPFWNLEYWKYTVFRIFLLPAFTYWAEILQMTLFYCTTDQVWVLSICVNFCGSYAPFGSQNTENTQFSALFSYMLWLIELKFCTLLCVTKIQIKFECRQFASSFVGVMPFWNLQYLKYTVFCTFLSHFDILSWNFAHDFVLMYYRSSLSVITLRQFLKELCLFVNLEYRKYTVFRTFLLHALTYWAEILHVTLFWCTSEQVQVSFLCVNFWRSYASFGTDDIGITQFSTVFSCMLWHIEVKFCTCFCVNVLQSKFECCHFASIFEGVMPLCELRI